MSYLNDVCKDCHANCEEYARELKKSRFMQRWKYDNSLADRYLHKNVTRNLTYSAKRGQRRQRCPIRRKG